MINVAELMADPDFVQEIPIFRRTVTMTDGVASYPETPDTIFGSVQPADGEAVATLPEGALLSDAIYVYTASDLRALRADGYGDIVVDSGRRYQVQGVDEAFRRYGYNRAVCLAEAMSGVADAE